VIRTTVQLLYKVSLILCGVLEVDAGMNITNGGGVDIALYGPVNGGCPAYTGGSYVDCESGIDPAPVMVSGVSVGDKYLVVIATQNRGEVNINSTANATALPVELISFDAKVIDKDVELSWSTSQEINNDYYSLYRSYDGQHFNNVTKVKADFNQSNGARYAYLDKNPLSGNIYYRLEQTDLDGNTTRLKTAVVNKIENSREFSVYPNPVGNSQLSLIGLEGNKNYQIEIYDPNGSLVQTYANIGQDDMIIDVSELSDGLYIIQVEGENNVFNSKFIKLNQ